ncbi:MAG: collagen binding domain-containing protein [Eubacteriales bacterium]|nr:collagen binding domain-containing protein [Eubacteriales bacterium]
MFSKNLKTISLVIALMLCFQLLSPFQGMNLLAEAIGNDLGNIFTFESLKVDSVEINEDALIEIDGNTTVMLSYTWEVTDGDAQAGDWARITVPQAFKPPTDFTEQPIIVNDPDDGPITVGSYSLSASTNVLEFVFNKEIEDTDIRNGIVGFTLVFNLVEYAENTIQEVAFQDITDKTFTITLKPAVDATSIDKIGVPDAYLDANLITWTVDFFNTELTDISALTVTDVIPEGLEYNDGSLTVYPLAYGYNGAIFQSEAIEVTPTIIDAEIALDFTEPLMPYEGYRLVYTTSITDLFKTSFTNNATLSYDDKNLTASSTVSGLERSNPLEKDGLNINDHRIRWTIDVNKSSENFTNAVLEDTLAPGLVPDSTSFEIYELNKSGNSWSQGDLVTLDPAVQGFPITFGAMTSEDAYRVIFFTDIDYSLVNGGIYSTHNSFINQAVLKDNGIIVGQDEDTVNIDRQPVLRKTSASNLQPGDAPKIVNWTVHINEANHPINNAIFTDTIPEGLVLNVADIRIYKNGTEIFLDPADITLVGSVLTIGLGDIGQDYYRITYPTTITDFTKNSFANSATLNGDGIGFGGVTTTSSISPANNTYEKAHRGTNYTNKTIDWRIRINPRRENIASLTITDTFPNAGLILLEDTLTITKGSTTLIKGTDYTLIPNTIADVTGYEKGFIVEFLAPALPLNALITITYITSFDPEQGIDPNTNASRIYQNKADFNGTTSNGTTVNLSRTAQYTLRTDAWNTGKKAGRRIHMDEDNIIAGWISGQERLIEWELYINYLKQDLGSNVQVIDLLDYDGFIDISKIKVKTYIVNTDGTTIIGDDAVIDYSIISNESGKGYTLTFDEKVDERYVIVFTTTVPDLSLANYSNNATVKIESEELPYSATVSYNSYNQFIEKNPTNVDGTRVYTDDEINWKIEINKSLSVIHDLKFEDVISEGLIYIQGSLEVFENVGNEEIELIEGEEGDYSLDVVENTDGTTTLSVAFNDTVSNLIVIRYSTVVLAESGTVNNTASISGHNLNEITVETSEMNASQSSFVGGETSPRKGKIVINKVDGDTGSPIDAEFELYYYLNSEERMIGDSVSTVNGSIAFNNLSFRTYYLREVQSPEGYASLSNDIEITLDRFDTSSSYNATSRTKTELVQNYRLGSLMVTKVDENDETIRLENAVYSLRNTDTQAIYTITTDEQGIAFIDQLPQGNYSLRETAPPRAYRLNDEINLFIIGYNSELDELRYDFNYTFENKKIPPSTAETPGSITVVKTDGSDQSKFLAGAEFEVRNNTGELIGVLVTDASGKAKIDKLTLGTYRVVETKPPAGYVYDGKQHEVFIGYSINIQLNVTNEKIAVVIDPVDPVDPVDPQDPQDPTDPEDPQDQEDGTVIYEPDEDVIDIEVVDPPKHGVIVIEDGKVKYIPDESYQGDDKVVIRITREDGTVEDITIEITDDLVPAGPIIPIPKTGVIENVFIYLALSLLSLIMIFIRKRKITT